MLCMVIDPSDERLRRLHGIRIQTLNEKKAMHSDGTRWEQISIHRFRQPTGFEVYIVTDGTHRMQAALELGHTEIEYRLVSEAELKAEVARRMYDFYDLM